MLVTCYQYAKFNINSGIQITTCKVNNTYRPFSNSINLHCPTVFTLRTTELLFIKPKATPRNSRAVSEAGNASTQCAKPIATQSNGPL